jgi:hypothetical protein
MRSPTDTARIVSSYQNDGLHPDVAGHKTMGESVDLNLFGGTDSTTVGVNSVGRIDRYALAQNYPNPFNPRTAVSFQLSAFSVVKLGVFDILGREIENLVDGERAPGFHTVAWDAASRPSGVYVYRMEASELGGDKGSRFVGAKKMILVR